MIRFFRTTILCLACLLVGFTPPDAPTRSTAVGSLANLTPEHRTAFTDHGEFEGKRAPGLIDWLAAHKEEGQTFDQFLRTRRNTPDSIRNTIYILPLGKFEKGKGPDLNTLRDYMQAYFHPMPVAFLPAIDAAKVKAKRRMHHESPQWNSREILAWMKPQLPKRAFAMLAVTITDLYPQEGWNFVFGQASLRERVGVFSFARYHPAFHGEAAGPDTEALILRRATKVLSHETGHMFGMKHCVFYECNMAGSNHLAETDASPMHLCPVCLRKLHHALRRGPLERYQKLGGFYQAHGLKTEDKWVRARAARIIAAGKR